MNNHLKFKIHHLFEIKNSKFNIHHMSTYKTQAIVIAKRPFIEDDRFYIVYSQDQGKLELMVRAAAKSSSKLAGQLEPFALVQLMIVRGKNLETIAGAQRLKSFNFPDLDSYYLASYFAEIISKSTKSNLADEKIYQLLFKALSFLERECMVEARRLMAVKFTWQLLRQLGHSVDLADLAGIKVLSGLSPAAKGLLNNGLLSQPNGNAIKTSTPILKEVEKFTQNYLKYILESDLKCLNSLTYA